MFLWQVFNVVYICVLPQTFIESNLKLIKKNVKSILLIWVIISYFQKNQYLDVIYEKFKMKQHIYV